MYAISAEPVSDSTVSNVPSSWMAESRRQDDVAGDAVVAGVVPGEGHGVVDIGGEPRGTGGRLRRRLRGRLRRGGRRRVDVEQRERSLTPPCSLMALTR